MKHLRYMGEFLSRRGTVWRVELLQESDEPFTSVGDLTFDADEALLIEWDDRSKEEVLCGSAATLCIESPGDRTYEDLYTVEPGRIRMDVYREGRLYWSGLLDPEFYEEPYERLSHYLVSLKFSDLGTLDRLKWTMGGTVTLRQVLSHCIGRIGLPLAVDESMISTCIPGSDQPMTLDSLKVRSDNFYDEDGEACTLKEVLEGVMQPLGLRIVQRAGTLYVYDLNGLYAAGSEQPVAWSGDRQTLGTDRVYNNVKITWSTYAQSGNLLPTECWLKDTDRNATALNLLDGRTSGDSRLYSYHYSTELDDWVDATDCGFTLWTCAEGKNVRLAEGGSARFFKIVPQYDGQECQGIALTYPSVRGYRSGGSAAMQWRQNGYNPTYMAGTLASAGSVAFRTNDVWIPPVADADSLMLRVAVNLLADPRFNPYEQAVNWMKYVEQKDMQNQWKARGNYLYMPVRILYRPDGSSTLYCWDNRSVVRASVSTSPVRTLESSKGVWRATSSPEGSDSPDVWGYLCWYDPAERQESCGAANGWRKNRPAINPHKKEITSVLQNCDDGQYLPYPLTGGGTLCMEVLLKGWMINDAGTDASADPSDVSNPHNLWDLEHDGRGARMNWLMLQLPEMEILNNLQFDAAIPTDDVEYSTELNSAAKESLEIETLCGTHPNGIPTARGCYYNAATGAQITCLTRAGRTTQAEQLLAGTLYSQYAGRRTRLQGEADLYAGGFCCFGEQNQEGKRFLSVGETQNLIMDTAELTITELRPDEYKEEDES